MADRVTSRNIEDLRTSLSDKLEELRRRANTATKVLAPATYWNDPVVRFGIGVAIGLVLGGRGRGTTAGHDGLVHAIVRAGLTAATTALITRALASDDAARIPAGAPSPRITARP